MKEMIKKLAEIAWVLLFLLCLPLPAQAGEAIPPEYYLTEKVGGIVEARYRDRGRYETESYVMSKGENAYLGYRYKVWLPKDEGAKQFPLVIMVNGTGSSCDLDEPLYEHLASWGFVVAGNTDPNTALGHTAGYTLALALRESETPGSLLYNKIDRDHIGLYGFSQGGPGAIHALLYRQGKGLYKTMVTVSAVTRSLTERLPLPSWRYDTRDIAIPYFMVASTGVTDRRVIAPLKEMKENFDALPSSLFSVMARRKQADHTTVQAGADGYITAWFCWQLKDDRFAAEAFTGEKQEIFHNPLWENVKRKGA